MLIFKTTSCVCFHLSTNRFNCVCDFFFRRHFEDLTDEEINFLAIVHALNTIVYPVIKDEFNKQCPDNELDKIRLEIYEHLHTSRSKDSSSEKDISQQTNFCLTQKQKKQLLSPISEFTFFRT